MKHSNHASFKALAATFALIFTISSVAQIEEIVVTARKKAENLQDIPVQVDVISSEKLERAGITSLEDISKMSASMVFDNGFSQQDTRITLRGLSPVRGRQNVAVLQDGVDLSSENLTIAGGTALINSRLFDLERVEVVKGPQSALYGRSAFAGAINYVTKKPTQEKQSSISATIASESEMDLRLSWSGGISENTAVGVNFASWSRDGYHNNIVSGQPVGGEEGMAGSITFNYEPTDDFSLLTRLEYTDDDYEPAAQFQQSGTTMLPISPNAIAPVNTCIIPTPTMCLAYFTSGKVISPLVTHMPSNVGLLPNIEDIGGAQLAINPRTGKDYPGANREIMKFSMTAVKEFENTTFTSITGLLDGDVFTFEDPQFRGTTNVGTSFGEIWYDQQTDLTSQEFRLQSNTDGALRWTIGAQLWEQEMQLDDKSFNTFTFLDTRPWFPPAFLNVNTPMFHGNASTFQGAICAPMTEGGEFAGCLDRGGSYWTRDTKHKSVYAMLEYDISDSLSLTVEGRYSEEDENTCGSDGNGTVDPNGVGFAGPGRSRVNPPMWTRQICGDHTEDMITPKVTLTHFASDDFTFYASLAQAKKPGGISTVTGGGFSLYDPEDNRFEAEEMTVYELGMKSTMMDGKMRFNADIFLQDFTDKQTATQVVNPDTGILQSKTTNAAKADVKGLELDVQYYINDNLSATLSYTHLNAKYEDFTRLTAGASNIANAGNCTIVTDSSGKSTCSIDLSGNPLENAPANSMVLGLNYNWETSNGSTWVAEADIMFQDERYIDQFKRVLLDGYYKVDLRLGYVTDNLEITAFIDNAFDDTSTRSGYGFTDFPNMKFILPIPSFCGVAGPGAGSGIFHPNPCIRPADISKSNGPSTFVLPTSHAMFFPDGRRFGIRIKRSF
jgi:outer membrane receptor protein involved in Fe transport